MSDTDKPLSPDALARLDQLEQLAEHEQVITPELRNQGARLETQAGASSPQAADGDEQFKRELLGDRGKKGAFFG